VFIVVVWLIFVVAGALFGSRKGRPLLGTLLGLFLGPVGVVIIYLVPPTDVTRVRRPLGLITGCPWCGEPIRSDSRICAHCFQRLTPSGRSGVGDELRAHQPDE
jgi:hypothetical protein